MDKEFSEINISVYHLIHFTELIDKSFSSYKELLLFENFKENKNESIRKIIYMNISSQIIMYTESLQEEYHDHFIAINAITLEEKAKVEQLREVLKPVFKKISGWSEIKDFRNNVLAHKPRIKNSGYKSVFLTKGLSGYNIPEKFSDFAFLVFCINTIKNFIYNVFKEEYHRIDELINDEDFFPKPLLPEKDYIKERDDLKESIKLIQKNISDRYQ